MGTGNRGRGDQIEVQIHVGPGYAGDAVEPEARDGREVAPDRDQEIVNFAYSSETVSHVAALASHVWRAAYVLLAIRRLMETRRSSW